MGWLPSLQDHPAMLVVLGFALLLNPFVVGAFDLGDPDWYRYEATEVTFHDNGTYDAPAGVGDLDKDIACLQAPMRRACMLERAVHANGGVEYDGLAGGFLQSDYQYVHVWEAGFFEPIATETGNGTVRYDLASVPTAEALRRASSPIERASPGVRAAITDGRYETSDELPGANELVRTDGGYYVVYPTASHVVSGRERRPGVVIMQWVAGVLGAVLVLYGQRRRVEQ